MPGRSSNKVLFSGKIVISLLLQLAMTKCPAQPAPLIDSFQYDSEIKVTFDQPAAFHKNKPVTVIFFALPNGNTTAQTMGKIMQPGDDWHFDIQHIKAQTAWIRKKLKKENIVVVYLENIYKSWPAWKQRHPEFRTSIPSLVDSLAQRAAGGKPHSIHLNGHSGGGSFIFGYLAGVKDIPSKIKRISFLDSNYGYDSTYFPMLKDWLVQTYGAQLNVFAYNDSVALYNGKPVVSPTGGTWYRSHLMLHQLETSFAFIRIKTDSLIEYRTTDKRIRFFLKPNYNRGIYHTQQVELNGFIHSELCGTRYEEKGYRYYGRRVYKKFIR
ncbi:MAG: hypothetical protein JNM88_06450 [Chitinophagaceae bacterium]|nr:hypothetical protein [Chitinophagaceae bacterium]